MMQSQQTENMYQMMGWMMFMAIMAMMVRLVRQILGGTTEKSYLPQTKTMTFEEFSRRSNAFTPKFNKMINDAAIEAERHHGRVAIQEAGTLGEALSKPLLNELPESIYKTPIIFASKVNDEPLTGYAIGKRGNSYIIAMNPGQAEADYVPGLLHEAKHLADIAKGKTVTPSLTLAREHHAKYTRIPSERRARRAESSILRKAYKKLTSGYYPQIANRDNKQEIRNLLRIHTTVESWGKPCITKLASLMGQPVPVTRENKARLIRQAEQYVKSSTYQPQVTTKRQSAFVANVRSAPIRFAKELINVLLENKQVSKPSIEFGDVRAAAQYFHGLNKIAINPNRAPLHSVSDVTEFVDTIAHEFCHHLQYEQATSTTSHLPSKKEAMMFILTDPVAEEECEQYASKIVASFQKALEGQENELKGLIDRWTGTPRRYSPRARDQMMHSSKSENERIGSSTYQPQTRSESTDDQMHLPEPGPVTSEEVEALKNKITDSMRKWLRDRNLPQVISEVNRCLGSFRTEFFDSMGADVEAVCRTIDGWLEQEEGAIPLVRWAGLAMCTGSAPSLLEYDEEAFGFLDMELGISQEEFLKAMMTERAFTESVLDGAGIGTLTLWRGLTGKSAERMLRNISSYGAATVNTHYGSSWSLSRKNAAIFAFGTPGVIIHYTIDANKILTTGVSNGRFGAVHEAEAIVFCPGKIRVKPAHVERLI